MAQSGRVLLLELLMKCPTSRTTRRLRHFCALKSLHTFKLIKISFLQRFNELSNLVKTVIMFIQHAGFFRRTHCSSLRHVTWQYNTLKSL